MAFCRNSFDHMFKSVDYGPAGTLTNVSITLDMVLMVGSILTLVAASENDITFQASIYDEDDENILLEIRLRNALDGVKLSNRTNGVWLPDVTPDKKIPISNEVRFAIVIADTGAAYRIVINQHAAIIFNHPAGAKPKKFTMTGGTVFKTGLLTPESISLL